MDYIAWDVVAQWVERTDSWKQHFKNIHDFFYVFRVKEYNINVYGSMEMADYIIHNLVYRICERVHNFIDVVILLFFV